MPDYDKIVSDAGALPVSHNVDEGFASNSNMLEQSTPMVTPYIEPGRQAAKMDFAAQYAPGGVLHADGHARLARAQQNLIAVAQDHAAFQAKPRLKSIISAYQLDQKLPSDIDAKVAMKAAMDGHLQQAQQAVRSEQTRLRAMEEMSKQIIKGQTVKISGDGDDEFLGSKSDEHRTSKSLKTDSNQIVHEALRHGEVPLDASFPKNERGNYVGAPESIKTPEDMTKQRDELVAKALKGINGRYWYEKSSDFIKSLTRGNLGDADKFAQLLAIYSPSTPVPINFAAAVRAWNQYKDGTAQGKFVPIRGGLMGAMDRRAEGVLYGDADWGGRKTNNFWANLMSRMDDRVGGKQGSTIDIWMMRALGYANAQGKEKGKEAPSDANYAYAENMLHHVSNQLSQITGSPWTPYQTQAALWETERGESDHANDFLSKDNIPLDYPASESKLDEVKAKLEGASAKTGSLRMERLLDPEVARREIDGLIGRMYADRKKLKVPAGIDKKYVKKRSDLVFANGTKGLKAFEAANPIEKTEETKRFLAELDHINDTSGKNVRSFADEYKKALKYDDLKQELAYRQKRATDIKQGVTNPQETNFQTVGYRNNLTQINQEGIPYGHELEGWPYAHKAAAARTLLPTIADLMNRVGVLHGGKPVIESRGDYENLENPVHALSTMAANAGYGYGDLDPSSRRLLDLASASLGKALGQKAAAYLHLTPITGAQGAAQFPGVKGVSKMDDPVLAGVPGDTGQRTAMKHDRADAVHIEAASHGSLSPEEMTSLFQARAKTLASLGSKADGTAYTADQLPMVATHAHDDPTKATGFVFLNYTGLPNRQFHKLVHQVTENADGDTVFHERLMRNDGNLIEAGDNDENYDDIIRKLGGDALLDHVSTTVAPAVRRLLDKYVAEHEPNQPAGITGSSGAIDYRGNPLTFAESQRNGPRRPGRRAQQLADALVRHEVFGISLSEAIDSTSPSLRSFASKALASLSSL